MNIGFRSDWHKSVGELTFDVGESTSYVGELVVGEVTRWQNDQYSSVRVPVQIATVFFLHIFNTKQLLVDNKGIKIDRFNVQIIVGRSRWGPLNFSGSKVCSRDRDASKPKARVLKRHS